MDKKQKKIKFIKLNNGEDLIAEIETETDKEYSLKNPMKVVIDMDLESSKQIIFLHPWLPTGIVQLNTIKLPANIVYLTTDVLADISEYYSNMAAEVEMSETLKKKQKKRKKKTSPSNPLEEDNILNFTELLERIKKNRPIH
jgi:hypothetical protein